MQLLYGNDGVNYHTIAKSDDITEQQEKELLENYLGYSFVPDSTRYSSAVNEPFALVFAVTDLSRTLPEEKVLFAKIARMSNFLTPSYYAHFQFVKPDEFLFSNGFVNLLKSSFINDTEVQDYLKKSIDTFVPTTNGETLINDNALGQEQLLSVIASLLNVADSLSQKVKLILDVEGDGYNQRALDVVASIYTYIPYTIRKMLGFSTYAGNGEKIFSNRVKLLIYSSDVIGRLEGDYIDLNECDVQSILKGIPESIVKMAREFVYDKIAREEWFISFQKLFGGKKATVKDHLVYFENIHNWREQSLDTICDSLALYAYQEQQKQETSSLFKMFCTIINERFVKEKYLICYQNRLKEMVSNQRGYEFTNELKAYMLLGEVLPSIEFDSSVFLKWQQRTIIDILLKNYEDMRLYQQLLSAYHSVKSIEFGGSKCKSVFLALENELRTKLEQLRKEIEGKIEEEERQIQCFFTECEIIPELFKKIEKQYAEIVYRKPNEKVFKKALGAAMHEYLIKMNYFSTFEKYTEYKAFAAGCSELVLDEDKQALAVLIEQKGEIVKVMEAYSRIVWKNKEEVLETYCNIVEMRRISQGKEILVPDYNLIIAGKEFIFKESELMQLIHFICAPNKMNCQEFEMLTYKKSGLVEALLKINVFDTGHFDTLLVLANDKSSVHETILHYYLTKGVLLSNETARKSIENIECSKLEDIMQDVESGNILTMEISEHLEQHDKNLERQRLRNAALQKAHTSKIKGAVTLAVAILVALLMGLVIVALRILVPIPETVWNIILMIFLVFPVIAMIVDLFSNKKNLSLIGICIGFLLIAGVLGGYKMFIEKQKSVWQEEQFIENGQEINIDEMQSGEDITNLDNEQ